MEQTVFKQLKYNIRCEWGLSGLKALEKAADIVIIVDILSFSTCVDIAVSNDCKVFPFAYKNETSENFAKINNAILAEKKRSLDKISLSPSSLSQLKKGERVILPSPNGSTLSINCYAPIIIAGCLRNAKAVADFANHNGKNILVIPAGEKWPDGSLRPSIEDWIGAGAIISYLNGSFSPESYMAKEMFELVKDNLITTLSDCSSGLELIEKGFIKDVELASELNSSGNVPVLKNGFYSKS